MLSIAKSRFGALLLMAAIVATLFVGYASATDASEEVEAASSATYYSFWLSCPGAGGKDTATSRTKESGLSYAYYSLTTVTNNTGYDAYINVRANNGADIAGEAEIVDGTGIYFVYYDDDYGNVGSKYCPSGQSDTESSAYNAVYMEGKWRP